MEHRLRIHIAVVRRDRADVFDRLRAEQRERNLTEVMWDRRFGERRAPQPIGKRGRRRTDRRGTPPATWEAEGYAVVALGG